MAGTADLVQIALIAVPVIIAITFHEAAHGFVALHFGDSTAKDRGRLTLNPLKHIDPFGTVLLPALLVLMQAGFIFGYAKPVPVNANALRNPKRDMIWVAGAGPGMNIVLAVVSALLLYALLLSAGGTLAWLSDALLISVEINLVLAIFNMLPLPPLDGSKVLAGFLPDTIALPYLRLGAYGFFVLLALLIFLPIVGQRLGVDLDLFSVLVQGPANFLARILLGPLAS